MKVVELGQLDALEKTIMGDNKNGFKKVERKGMANVKAHKKPMVIKPKKWLMINCVSLQFQLLEFIFKSAGLIRKNKFVPLVSY